MNVMPWLVFFAAAILEVGGDALVRVGLRGGGVALVIAGMATLGAYGLVVNSLSWDFARLLGSYVALFAITSALFGRFAFGEALSPQTCLGLAVILAGSVILQAGR